MATFHRRTYLVPPEHEETFTAELWPLGILGCEIRDETPGGRLRRGRLRRGRLRRGRLRIDVYLPDPLPPPFAAWDGGAWRARGVEAVAEERFAERDWLAEYRAAARPIAVGRTFLVDPRDEGDAAVPSGGRTELRIPARTAFGTGSHESTRLAVEWLEDLDVRGLDVLDVGTGSGILAFAALKLGARRVVGFDSDAAAVLVACQNRALNRLYPLLFAGRLAALRGAAAFDLALVNVLPERVLDEIPRLLGVLRPGARVISSGNLWRRRRELVARFEPCGLALEGEKRDGDWVAFLLRGSF